jgi:succinate dehydrogenase hydrophobic anchor subunit
LGPAWAQAFLEKEKKMKSKERITAIMLALLLIGILASGIAIQTAKESGIARVSRVWREPFSA